MDHAGGWHFPFGAPAPVVRQQALEGARAFVLGVHAGAVVAKWIDALGTLRSVAIAVASEPHLYWRGDDEAQVIAAVRPPAIAGRLHPPGFDLNGQVGRALDQHFLRPLGLTRATAWLCDLMPEYRLNDAQRETIQRSYAPLARKLGLPAATIPRLPAKFADAHRIEQIVEEFLASGAETLITLGDTVLREFARPLRISEHATVAGFGLRHFEYGASHPFTLRGRKFQLMPLVHPRQAASLGGHTPQLVSVHAIWARLRAGGSPPR